MITNINTMKLTALLYLVCITSLSRAADPSLELTLPTKWFAVPGVPPHAQLHAPDGRPVLLYRMPAAPSGA